MWFKKSKKKIEKVRSYSEIIDSKIFTEDPKELLQQTESHDFTVAQHQIIDGWIPSSKELLKLVIDNFYYINDKKNTIAHYLANNNKQWITYDKDILSLKNKNGETVACYLAKRDYYDKTIKTLDTEDPEILFMIYNEFGSKLVSLMISNGWTTKNKELLKKGIGDNGEINDTGNTIAHYLAMPSYYGCNTVLLRSNLYIEDYDILSLTNKENLSVADYLISNSMWKPENKETYKYIIDKNNNWTIAHSLAKRNYFDINDEDILSLTTTDGLSVKFLKYIYTEKHVTDNEILKLSNPSTGNTIAHFEVIKGYIFEDENILKLTNNDGLSVGMFQTLMNDFFTFIPGMDRVEFIKKFNLQEINDDINLLNKLQFSYSGSRKIWITENPNVLVLKDKFGWSIAHQQAKNGWKTNNKEILHLEDNYGISVKDVIKNNILK
jgi:hypothetical protein